jgi:hypothetical protein
MDAIQVNSVDTVQAIHHFGLNLHPGHYCPYPGCAAVGILHIRYFFFVHKIIINLFFTKKKGSGVPPGQLSRVFEGILYCMRQHSRNV